MDQETAQGSVKPRISAADVAAHQRVCLLKIGAPVMSAKDTNPAKRISAHPFSANAKEFVQVRVDDRIVGGYEIVKGGFLPYGKRKPRETPEDAQYIIILDAATRKLREGARLMDSLQELRTIGVDG